MKHYGDITKISGYDVPIVDVVTGGSPCQDLSVAGKRAGLAGERSGLFMEQMRIIREMREKDARDTGRTARANDTRTQTAPGTRRWVIPSRCRFGNGWQGASPHSMNAP